MREALRGMLRTRYMTLISILSITVTLTVLGVFTIVTVVVNELIEKVRKSEEINVYLKDEMSDEDMLALDASIVLMSEVESTRIVSKEDAAKEFEEIFGSNLLNALDENPLPRTITIVMSKGYRMSTDLENVVARIIKVDGVESVEYGREWLSKMDIFFLMFFIGETILIVLAVTACIMVISNTISLTVMARKDTIEIMRLVGATDSFIRKPFYIEGTLQGLLSGCASFCVLFGSYQWLRHMVPDIVSYIFLLGLPNQSIILHRWSLAIIIPMGGIMGLLGSYVAVKRTF